MHQPLTTTSNPLDHTLLESFPGCTSTSPSGDMLLVKCGQPCQTIASGYGAAQLCILGFQFFDQVDVLCHSIILRFTCANPPLEALKELQSQISSTLSVHKTDTKHGSRFCQSDLPHVVTRFYGELYPFASPSSPTLRAPSDQTSLAAL
jgi:hypothetical protein